MKEVGSRRPARSGFRPGVLFNWWLANADRLQAIFQGDSTMAEEGKPAPETQAHPQPQQPPPQAPQFTVDTSALSTAYANFCRVTGTPEELVLDFGLNTQMSPTPTEAIKLTHRLVINFFT